MDAKTHGNCGNSGSQTPKSTHEQATQVTQRQFAHELRARVIARLEEVQGNDNGQKNGHANACKQGEAAGMGFQKLSSTAPLLALQALKANLACTPRV